MSDSKQLPNGTETDQEILRRTISQSLARSPTQVERGQVVVLDKRGVAVKRSRTTHILKLVGWGLLAGQIAGPLMCLGGMWLAGAAVYLGTLSVILHAKYRGDAALIAVETLAREGNLDEAQRRFDLVPELRRRNPSAYCMLAGILASHRGEYEAAITWWREALGHAKGLRAERLKISITKALLLLDRPREARLVFETVALPLEADEVLTTMLLVRVMFVLYDPSPTTTNDELHAWARRALEYSHTGVELAAIGWAFERNGDEDMASFLASEAGERMHYRYLATWWPALQQWLDDRPPKAAIDVGNEDVGRS